MAARPHERMRGLLGRKSLAEDEGHPASPRRLDSHLLHALRDRRRVSRRRRRRDRDRIGARPVADCRTPGRESRRRARGWRMRAPWDLARRQAGARRDPARRLDLAALAAVHDHRDAGSRRDHGNRARDVICTGAGNDIIAAATATTGSSLRSGPRPRRPRLRARHGLPRAGERHVEQSTGRPTNSTAGLGTTSSTRIARTSRGRQAHLATPGRSRRLGQTSLRRIWRLPRDLPRAASATCRLPSGRA